MRSNIALGYIAMLSVVGFFLWVIRNFIRALRKKDHVVPLIPVDDHVADTDKKSVNWPLHIFLHKEDDIPIPGSLVAISEAYAFMESSACLQTGQEISLYIDVPERDQMRLTARVIWARQGRDGRNAAQLSFGGLNAEKKKDLFAMAQDAESCNPE